MSEDQKDLRVPDLLLERYRLGELAPAEVAGLEGRLAADAELRERVAALERSDAQIRQDHPPEWLAERVRARLATPRPSALVERQRAPLRLLVTTAAAMAVVILALRPRVFSPGIPEPTAEVPVADVDSRIKGPGPRLAVFRKTGEGSEALEDGALAHPGDLIRVGYRVADITFGAILSIDGRGTVTKHLPRAGGQAARLISGDTVLLDDAYELDDAPRWETFFFVTGKAPFELAPVLEAARRAAAPPTARPTALALPPELDQKVISIEKGSRR